MLGGEFVARGDGGGHENCQYYHLAAIKYQFLLIASITTKILFLIFFSIFGGGFAARGRDDGGGLGGFQ